MEVVLLLLGAFGIAGFSAAAAAVGLAGNVLYICEPNEVLIFSGRRRATTDGTKGYRIIKGGRGWRLPLVERVDRLDLTHKIIDVEVRGAYS